MTHHADGEPVGQGGVAATEPFIFSADEATDVGYDSGTPMSPDAPRGSRPSDTDPPTPCRPTAVISARERVD